MIDGGLLAFFGLALVVAWWYFSIKARERAIELARRHCQLNGWQLLDYTVQLQRLWPEQTQKGWRLRRHYRFDFSSDGADRFNGSLVMVDGTSPIIQTDTPMSG